MLEKEITFDRFIRGLISMCVVGLVIFIIHQLSNVLLPFFIAWVIAYMLYPMVTFCEKRLHIRYRTVSIVLTLLAVGALLTGAILLIVPPAVAEFVKLKDFITQYLSQNNTGNELARMVESLLREYVVQNNIVRLIQEDNLMEAFRLGASQIWGVVASTVNFTLGVLASLIVLLYLFFILLDYETMSKGWLKLIPRKNRAFAGMLADDVKHGMNAYFRGQSLVALLVGIMFSIGFVIIDFPLAIGLGLFIGVLNLVPYLQIVGIIPTIMLALLKAANTGESLWMILATTAAVFVVVQIIQDMILVPKIMGKLMGLNPAIILLSLSIWGSILGVIGLIIALPITTLILSYYKRFIIKERNFKDVDSVDSTP